jgi:hypothetical protein
MKIKPVCVYCGHYKNEHYSFGKDKGCRHCEENDAMYETGDCRGFALARKAGK